MPRVRLHGLGHTQPAVPVAAHERVLHERLDGVEVGIANGLDAGDRRAVREDAPAREQRSLPLLKDAERPLERRAGCAGEAGRRARPRQERLGR